MYAFYSTHTHTHTHTHIYLQNENKNFSQKTNDQKQHAMPNALAKINCLSHNYQPNKETIHVGTFHKRQLFLIFTFLPRPLF